MNKDQFWEIIDSVNQSALDKDQESRRCRMVEKLNYERFGSVAYEAYDAKLFRVDPDSQKTMFDALNGRTLDRQIIEDIHAELPERKDIDAGWSMWTLPELFPGICREQEPKDIAGLLKTGNIVYGYVYNVGQPTQYIFQHTPQNIANFIGGHMDASEIIVTDGLDRLILNTNGRFIDRCPDKALLEKVKEVLIPIQMGEANAQPFFCPTSDEVDAYYAQNEGDITDECD